MTRLKDGTKTHLYLLDEQLGMEKIDLISTNLAEKMPIRIWDFFAINLPTST